MKRNLLPFAVVLLAACAQDAVEPLNPATEASAPSLSPATAASHAWAELWDASGQSVGVVRFTQDAAGRLHVSVQTKGVTPGLHGLHLHAVGECDGGTPTPFSSAGGHFNPTAREHGFRNPNGHHAGDLPNLEVNGVGVGRLSATVDHVSLDALFDANGTAVVLHQNEDDLSTNSGPQGPGNSGARIACGVLKVK